MTDLTSLLERADRAVAGVPLPTGGLDRLRSLRDRKQRNQRIAAGVVGMAVFVAAVWIVTTGGPFDRTQTPATSGGAETGPTLIPDPERVGFIGLPPAGSTPSSPEAGEVVLRATGRCTWGPFCHVWVYADGRLIWIADQYLPYGANERTTGLLEQRLTPEGVELLVSEFTSAGACSPPSDSGSLDCSQLRFPAITKPGWTDPAWGLPASAWEDPEIRAFVPSRFGACFLQEGGVSQSSPLTWHDIEPSRVLAWIPSSAADLLRGKDVELPWGGLDDPPLPKTCFSLTSEEARAVSERLDEAGIERDERQQPYVLGYQLVGPNRFPEPVFWIGPILPHGEWIVSGFG